MDVKNSNGLLGVGILVLVFVFGASAYFLSQKDAGENSIVVPESAGLPDLPPMIAPRPYVADDGVVELPVTHTYVNGVHIFSGAFDKPGECFETSSAGSFVDGDIQLVFEMHEPAVPCGQSLVVEEFSVRVAAPEDAPVYATFNGDKLRLVLEEA